MTLRGQLDLELVHARLATLQTLDRLGLEARHYGEARAQIRCPAHDDRNPSCSVTIKDGRLLWHCFACDAGGDVVELVRVVRGLATAGDAIKAAAELADVEPDSGPPLVRPHSPRRSVTYERPPRREVLAVWESAVPAHRDGQAAKYLAGRGLDAGRLSDHGDLVRAIRPGATLPRWARFRGVPWSHSGHRLVVPMFGSHGELESLHARSLLPGVSGGEKAAAPAGASLRGLVMACPLARQILGGSPLVWWPRPWQIVVAEGEPDFLTWASRWGEAAECAPATIGVVAGCWTPELAARLPVGAELLIRTHNDAAGDRYAAAIAATVAGRCSLFRRKPTA